MIKCVRYRALDCPDEKQHQCEICPKSHTELEEAYNKFSAGATFPSSSNAQREAFYAGAKWRAEKIDSRTHQLNDMLATMTSDAAAHVTTIEALLLRRYDAWAHLHIDQARELIDYSTLTPVTGGATPIAAAAHVTTFEGERIDYSLTAPPPREDCGHCGYRLCSIAHFEHCGHGHVTKRHDGKVMRCGGPASCYGCAVEKEALTVRIRGVEVEWDTGESATVKGILEDGVLRDRDA